MIYQMSLISKLFSSSTNVQGESALKFKNKNEIFSRDNSSSANSKFSGKLTFFNIHVSIRGWEMSILWKIFSYGLNGRFLVLRLFCHFNPLKPGVAFLYPLKTSENQRVRLSSLLLSTAQTGFSHPLSCKIGSIKTCARIFV